MNLCEGSRFPHANRMSMRKCVIVNVLNMSIYVSCLKAFDGAVLDVLLANSLMIEVYR